MDTLHRLNERAQEYAESAIARYRALSPRSRAVVIGLFALNVFFFVCFWAIGPEKVFEQFARWADYIASHPYGWAILFTIIVVTSVPPLLGYGTAQTLVGFAYGVWPGFAISAVSCLAGGAFAFLVVRRFVRYFAPFVHQDSTHKALSRAVRAKGLPLMMMLRLCPFPYPWSNAFFASIETVTLGHTITPKLLLHVFVGHRTYLFASPESRHAMDPLSKWLNGAFMVLGTLLGAGTSWYLYKLTMRYVAESAELGDGGPDGADELEAGLLDEVDGLLRTGGTAQAGGRASQEGWGERLSDFEGEGEGGEGGAEGQGEAAGSRRNSTAWGLDLDLAEEEVDEAPQGRVRLD